MVPIAGVKVLEGRELQAGEFTFQLVSGEGENERVIAVTNNGQGIFAFPANALTYTVADLADVAPAADGTRTKEFFYVVRELVARRQVRAAGRYLRPGALPGKGHAHRQRAGRALRPSRP